jgi:hypothetical protein
VRHKKANQRPAAGLGNEEIRAGAPVGLALAATPRTAKPGRRAGERQPYIFNGTTFGLARCPSLRMFALMLRRLLVLFLLLGVGRLAAADAPAAPAPALTGWDRITVAPMKTSIYVGTVALTTSVFERKGSTLSATYEAKVFPWFFWDETGRITITLSDANLASMAKGETTEFAGEASNHKGKPRTVSGRAQPADAVSGKIKVRIGADGYELIFNSTYRFGTK